MMLRATRLSDAAVAAARALSPSPSLASTTATATTNILGSTPLLRDTRHLRRRALHSSACDKASVFDPLLKIFNSSDSKEPAKAEEEEKNKTKKVAVTTNRVKDLTAELFPSSPSDTLPTVDALVDHPDRLFRNKREEHEKLAPAEVMLEVVALEKRLKTLDETSQQAVDLRKRRRNLLEPYKELLKSQRIEAQRLSSYQEGRKNARVARTIYFHRHRQMGKIYVSDTQWLDEKQFHHQMGLKTGEKIIKCRIDHWEPLLAVTGLPYAKDVERVMKECLDPNMQEIERYSLFYKRRPNKNSVDGPNPFKDPNRVHATKTLLHSKRAVTRLCKALKSLQKDCGDLKNVKIYWRREGDRQILCRADLRHPAQLAVQGTWPDFVEHDRLEVHRSGFRILNLEEDISYERESRIRHRLMREMPLPHQPWYPLLAPGRAAWLRGAPEEVR